MKPALKFILIGLLVLVLVLIRYFENKFFYDPFMLFLDTAFAGIQNMKIYPQLYVNLAVRFVLNSLISLAILLVAFQNKEILKVSAIIYALCGLVLFPIFISEMQQIEAQNYLTAFYIRRFLAHPLLILILLPAFIYNQLHVSKM